MKASITTPPMTGKSIVDIEREKYERVYQFKNYGNGGHAVTHAQALISRAAPGATVADFGCGRGGSFKPFIDAGLRIVPVDHVDVLDTRWRAHPSVEAFHRANLWADQLPRVDYGVCTDVMEHIPEEFVDDALLNIARAVRLGCLWTICHVPDAWGKRIGASLHMTVKPREWWTERLRKHWSAVDVINSRDNARGLSVTTAYWTEHRNGDVRGLPHQGLHRPPRAEDK